MSGVDGLEGPAHGIGWRQVVQSLVGLALAGTLLVFGLPWVTDTTWSAIGAQLSLVGGWVALLMALLMLTGLYCYTFTLKGSLTGLSARRALMVNMTGSMVSNILPGGGAVGVAVSVLMYRSWGFTRRNISTSVVVTTVWNMMARLVLPVLGVLTVVVGPVDAPQPVVVASAVAAVAGTAVLGLSVAVIWSEDVSARVGRSLERVAGRLPGRLRRGPGLGVLFQDQRRRCLTVVRRRGLSMTLGLAGMFTFFFALYAVACHAVGVELPLAQLFAAYAFRQFLTVVAITPGGLGVTEAGTAGVLVAFGADPAAAGAAALLYAAFTHLLVVPLGLLTWLAWWVSPKRPTPSQLGEDGVTRVTADPGRRTRWAGRGRRPRDG